MDVHECRVYAPHFIGVTLHNLLFRMKLANTDTLLGIMLKRRRFTIRGVRW
jgi:hypothetical protein